MSTRNLVSAIVIGLSATVLAGCVDDVGPRYREPGRIVIDTGRDRDHHHRRHDRDWDKGHREVGHREGGHHGDRDNDCRPSKKNHCLHRYD